MAPRTGKREPTVEELKRLLQDHRIEFVGPVPPREWPTEYEHLFRTIRDIRNCVAEEYGQNTTGSRSFFAADQHDRVRQIRHAAARLRQNVSYSESTWRELVETIVVDRFKKEVLWSVSLWWNIVRWV
jgi:hypothetical protein